MKNKGLKKEYSHLVVSLVVLATLLGGYFGLYWYIGELKDDVSDLRNSLASQSSREESGRSAADLLRKTEQGRRDIGKHLVRRENFVALVEEIEMIRDITGVTLKKEFDERADQVVFELQVNGSFEDIMYFLRLIETLPFRVAVNTSYVDQLYTTRESAGNEWRGELTVVLYGHNLATQ